MDVSIHVHTQDLENERAHLQTYDLVDVSIHLHTMDLENERAHPQT